VDCIPLDAVVAYGVVVGCRLALHSFIRNFLDNDLRNDCFAFLKGLGHVCHEAVTALVDGHVVEVRLARDRVVINQGAAFDS
jgi:hypothetical protein